MVSRTRTSAGPGRAAALSALVATAGCALSLGVSVLLAHREDAAATVQMDRRASAAADAVRSETRRYLDALRIAASGAGAQEDLTAPEFAEITRPLGTMQMGGASSIALVVPATGGDVAEVQRAWRARGATGLTLSPEAGDEHAFPVFMTSLDGASLLLGTDLMAAPAPAEALTAARRSGNVSVAGAGEQAFYLTAPVQRGPHFLGWLQLAVRGQNFMRTTFTQAGQGVLDLTLRAGPATVAETLAAADGERNLQRRAAVRVADDTWSLDLAAASERLPGAHSGLPIMAAGGGLSLSLLLTILVWVLVTGRERARAQVVAATGELHAREAESRGQASLLQAVLDGISDGVGVVGPDGRFLLHNPAARKILGRYEQDEDVAAWQGRFGLFRLDGSTPFPTDDLPLVRALHGQNSDQVEMVVRNSAVPDGRVISVSARPLETAAGDRGAVAVFHDITERKRVETELRGFAGVVAHDLKSPLTSIRGYTELINEALATLSPAASAEAMQQARRGTAKVLNGTVRMEKLINELLDYAAARDATLRIAEVSLRDVVDDVVNTRIDAPSECRPDVFVGELPPVMADPVLLRQVVDNLVGNAIKYTPPGQPPRIDITAGPEDPATVRVQIADRGIGIPDGEHASVFDSFHRASNGGAHPGTGLGLAICRRIVERHGGWIEAAANPGGGTVFTFTLPAATLAVTGITAAATPG